MHVSPDALWQQPGSACAMELWGLGFRGVRMCKVKCCGLTETPSYRHAVPYGVSVDWGFRSRMRLRHETLTCVQVFAAVSCFRNTPAQFKRPMPGFGCSARM